MDALRKAFFGHRQGDHIYYRHHNTATSLISMDPEDRIEARFLSRVGHLEPEQVT